MLMNINNYYPKRIYKIFYKYIPVVLIKLRLYNTEQRNVWIKFYMKPHYFQGITIIHVIIKKKLLFV